LKNESDNLEEIRRAVVDGVTDRKFWHSRTPHERLFAAMLMRQRKYGDDVNTRPIERIFEISTRVLYDSNHSTADRDNPS
jgi:hypothetical protein